MEPEPQTPRSLPARQYIKELNETYGLDLPMGEHINYSPSAINQQQGLKWKLLPKIRFLFFNHRLLLTDVVTNFHDWVVGNNWSSTIQQRLEYLWDAIDDEMYFLRGGSGKEKLPREAHKRESIGRPEGDPETESPKRQRISHEFERDHEEDEDGFRTAPTSPVKNSPSKRSANLDFNFSQEPEFRPEEFDESPEPTKPKTMLELLTAVKEEAQLRSQSANSHTAQTTHTISPATMRPPNRPRHSNLGGPSVNSQAQPNTSFMTNDTTITNDDTIFTVGNDTRNQSFATEITEPDTQESNYASGSVLEQWLYEESANLDLVTDRTEAVKHRVINSLLEEGPFSLEQTLPGTISLRCRYEVERIGRFWGVSLRDMIRGDKDPAMEYDAFWTWVRNHSMRKERPLPDRPSRRAWDAAVGSFKTDRHSEVVYMTGILEWSTDDSEPGFYKLTLSPFKTDRTCRLHRQFGSDKFLTLLMPPTTKPPPHLGAPSSPALLRQSIATWLTRNEHQCLGRTWRAFYLEDVQRKGKEPLHRVHLFAVDGVDFCPAPSRSFETTHSPKTANSALTKTTHDDLLEWHLHKSSNSGQNNCKLFQRIALGLSKTYATVKLKPYQIVPIKDEEPVMNDGCGLMSRALANKIANHLGITGNTPSAFQGRIAGAKGLWMVDRHKSVYDSFAEDDREDIWLEITDSQLKIHPHPASWNESDKEYDEEKLIFEVCKWSKPLHSVELNIQLLSVLDHGSNSNLRTYLAKLTRDGINQIAEDFEEALASDNSILCRALVQKFKPSGDENFRQMDQWANRDSEGIIRMSEAGFSPLSFYPLRDRLQDFFKWTIDRHVEDIRIEVPLSTYAFCIADPYGVLEPHEVYLGFSAAWKSHDSFQGSIVEGDVLVGRTPAHLPSDIQRRTAVYKNELRHFMDVIVFSTKGDVPLAHLLSGGDYDGDAPWICWDPDIVDGFSNSDLPKELSLPAEYFALTKHTIPMSEIKSTEHFLQTAFEFNFTLSNLGRCTREHEKIQYEMSLNNPAALEVGSLLGHLVDSRKSGVVLSEEAWKTILRRVSPKERLWPGYIADSEKQRHKPKKSNIIDYLKFWVAKDQGDKVRSRIEAKFHLLDMVDSRDKDLIRPWEEAKNTAKQDDTGSLRYVLNKVEKSIAAAKTKWLLLPQENQKPPQAADCFSEVCGPESDHLHLHPLVHTWQNSPKEWQRLLASCTYRHSANSRFTWFAVGDTLCDLKAETFPSRVIINDISSIYRVNQKAVASLKPGQLIESEADEVDEFEGGEELETLVLGSGIFEGLEDRAPIE